MKTSAPVIISVIVLIGFAIFSLLAMKPESAGVSKEVMLFLLGSWSTLAAGVVNYWVGSSAGSKNKEDLLAKQVETKP